MERLTRHAEVQELLGAYALDALDPDEAEEVERHLADCPRCRAEVAEHREVAGLLGYAGSSAPAGVWDRIATSLEEPPPAMRLTRTAPAPVAGEVPADVAEGGGVVPIGRGRRPVGTRAFAMMAAVAALVAAVLGVEVARLNSRTDHLKGSIGVEAMDAAYKNAVTNPGARRVSMRSSDGSLTTLAVILPDGTGYIDSHALPPLPRTKTYQLWGVVGTDRVSLAVLGNIPRIQQFGAPDNMTGLALTDERAGGVVVSQSLPVVSGAVPTTA